MHIRPLMLGVAAIVALAGPAFAAGEAEPAAPECRKAEVNPVTGHVLCVEPLGAFRVAGAHLVAPAVGVGEIPGFVRRHRSTQLNFG